MSKIQRIDALEVLDSRGNPTLEVQVHTEKGGFGRAIVPSGASTGMHEAFELRDGDAKRFHGKGVQKALQNVLQRISKAVLQMESTDQKKLDQALCSLDEAKNKKNIGANAMLGVSLAVAKASANELKMPLYKYVGKGSRLPRAMMNVINGGAHADNGLDVQEFMILPKLATFAENLRAGSEIFQTLKKILNKRHLSTGVGDEGGFAPTLKNNQEALDLLMEAITQSNYEPGKQVDLALDVAATELFSEGMYRWQKEKISGKELVQIYAGWCAKYPIASIEDGCSEDDWSTWKLATDSLKIQLVGDDLFVTNPERLAKGIEGKVANALLVKPNQIGTLSETIEAVQMAQNAKYKTVMSHRSGETEDTTISHLAVGLGCEMIKTGSVCRGERTAKYNELLRIESGLAGF